MPFILPRCKVAKTTATTAGLFEPSSGRRILLGTLLVSGLARACQSILSRTLAASLGACTPRLLLPCSPWQLMRCSAACMAGCSTKHGLIGCVASARVAPPQAKLKRAESLVGVLPLVTTLHPLIEAIGQHSLHGIVVSSVHGMHNFHFAGCVRCI